MSYSYVVAESDMTKHTHTVNTALYITPKKEILSVLTAPPPKKKGEMIDMLSRLVVELILQYTCISTHYVVHLIYV